MSTADRYKQIFGSIDSLAEPVSWAGGISNMLEWLCWGTQNILGVTKTALRKKIVELSHDPAVRDLSLQEKQRFVEAHLELMTKASERPNRYDRPSASVANPREALRRAKFFSEEYLNKEWDIFLSLASDVYLDSFYRQFTSVTGGGSWAAHGNGGLFVNSTGIYEMRMDSLSYSEHEHLLVANELKLGGTKNPDQLLKYALMHRLLAERGFIVPGTRLVLLFIGDKPEMIDWEAELEREIAYCQKSTKSTSKAALAPEVLETARQVEYAATTWADIVAFNEKYLLGLDPSQQVERKLLAGFNETLTQKAFYAGD